MKVFYARCSAVEQNEARQLQTAREIGADKVFLDKASGKDANRPELQKMLDFVREGDTVYCSDFSRIARNTRDLLSITEHLEKRDVQFCSLKESVDTATPQGRFMLTVFGAMAELERETILQRQREGIAIAKAAGKYKGRQKQKIDVERFKAVCAKWRAGEITAVKAMDLLQLKPNTFYRRVKEYCV